MGDLGRGPGFATYRPPKMLSILKRPGKAYILWVFSKSCGRIWRFFNICGHTSKFNTRHLNTRVQAAACAAAGREETHNPWLRAHT